MVQKVANAGTGSGPSRNVVVGLTEALGSALDMRLVLERAYPLLLRLVAADYGALGISSTGHPRDFEWMVAGLPPAFFASYPDMAAHDFVRTSVATAPNVVLRDDEMVSRPVLEANPMYRRAREVGVPLQQVMAVMLHIDGRWQSGLSLFRDRRRPFTDRDRAALQSVTPALSNAVRNCQVHRELHDRLQLAERVAQSPLSLPSAWTSLLTPQQRRVVAGVLRGWDNQLIGSELGCATTTVKKHLQFIFDRLGVPSRTALIARAAADARAPAQTTSRISR